MLPYKEPSLSPEELTAYMARYNLDDVTLAKNLGITERLVRRYLDGEKPVPEPTARLARLLRGEATIAEFL